MTISDRSDFRVDIAKDFTQFVDRFYLDCFCWSEDTCFLAIEQDLQPIS
jgi:hypothetical protein